MCCCCCEQGPVNIALTAEKTGYIPGEYILLTGEVTNRAGWHIENSVIKLIQVSYCNCSNSLSLHVHFLIFMCFILFGNGPMTLKIERISDLRLTGNGVLL